MPLNQRAILLLGTVAAAALAAAAGDARADQINVSATITASCDVTDGDLDFGTYDAAVDSEATTTLSVTCSAPTDVGVTLDFGQHKNGGSSRRMQHETDTGAFLAYALCEGSCAGGSGPTWNEQEVLVDVDEDGAAVTVGGRILATQAGLPSGAYTDVVLVTLDVKS
jgi:spore coat protein U-like protein